MWFMLTINLFFATSITATSLKHKTVCPQNEEYKDCAVGLCINTCKNPRISLTCKAPCFPGCGCIENYLRNTEGFCVLPEKCDVCKKNEIFSLSANTECENTCEDPRKSKTCTSDKTFPGCTCKKGFFRNSENKCVLPHKCENFMPPEKKICPRTGLPFCTCHMRKFYDD